MSHFTVLVIGPDIEEQLQPYHEYESTGTKDKYVINVDKTEEVNEWLQRKVFYGMKKEDGAMDYEYRLESANEKLLSYVEIPRSEYFIREGLNETKEIIDWFGYEFTDGKWTKFTNPNAKWDWWVIGGRWTGSFRLKPVAQGEIGTPGLMTTPAKPGHCDSAQKKDIDFDSMKAFRRLEAEREWHAVNDIITKSPSFRTWDEITESKNYGNEQRALYNSQQEVIAFRNINYHFSANVEDYFIPKEAYIQKEIEAVAVTFAVVKDNMWYEKGKMGWWCSISDEKKQSDWNREFWALVVSLPDTEMLTIVDCHI